MFKQNSNFVKLVFKHYPLPNHNLARPAALAAMAAHEQGKFWAYHDKVFEIETKNLKSKDFVKIAEELGLDMEKFNADMKSEKLVKHILADINDANSIGVTGTPSVFVNGKKTNQRSVPGFQQLINYELQKSLTK